MTTPHNIWGPYVQQRWIEGKNVGSVDIPPHSVVEVSNAERPEEASVLTPSGGRTTLHVRRSTVDSPSKTVITGPLRIRVGEIGPVTDANIAYVRHKGLVSIGDQVNVTTDEDEVETGQVGYIVLGDIQGTANAGTCRVMRSGGGGGGLLIGVLENDCAHKQAVSVRVTSQTEIVDAGDSISIVTWAESGGSGIYMTCLNLTRITLIKGNTAAGNADAGPFVKILSVPYHAMPLIFPHQIEECLLPAQALEVV